jgi:hypothetical protein
MIDKLIKQVTTGLSKIPDHRAENRTYILSTLLNTGFAMFSLKDSSLSSFREQYPVRSENLKRVYNVEELPCDSAFRGGLDGVNPKDLQNQFKIPLQVLRNKGVFKSRTVLGDYLAIAFDGTNHYCSSKKSCPHCLVRKHRNGSESYYHQLLGAVNVHPNQSTVFPIACEAIVKQDGATKNDCEQNAAKRLIPTVREHLPSYEVSSEPKLVGIFDALYATAPHIDCLSENNVNYIIATKGKTYVDIQAKQLDKEGKLKTVQWTKSNDENILCTAKFANSLILSGQRQEILTNYVEYSEVDTKSGETTFYSTWITDIPITEDNIQEFTVVARARWKIENETFNTLKNQGYHLEHNYGHGKQFLTTNFALLTFLAFLTDQIAQHLDTNFQKAKAVCKTFKAFWQKVRYIFYLLPVMSMNAVYKFIITRKQVNIPALE